MLSKKEKICAGTAASNAVAVTALQESLKEMFPIEKKLQPLLRTPGKSSPPEYPPAATPAKQTHFIQSGSSILDIFHHVPPTAKRGTKGLVVTTDTFYWLLSKSSLSQSEALLNKSRFALLECAIHVFNTVSQCPSLQQKGGGKVKQY